MPQKSSAWIKHRQAYLENYSRRGIQTGIPEYYKQRKPFLLLYSLPSLFC